MSDIYGDSYGDLYGDLYVGVDFEGLIVEFSPTTGPFDEPEWVVLTDGGPHDCRVIAASWSDGKQADLDEFPPGEATVVLRNDDRLFDPDYTAGTYYGQLNPRVPFRIRALLDGVDYDLYYGFVEEGWEQFYNPPEASTCTVKLVDLVGVIQGYTLPSVLEVEILADDPIGYWPLQETSGDSMYDRGDSHHAGSYTEGTTRLSETRGTITGFNLDGEHFGRTTEIGAALFDRPGVIEAVIAPDVDGPHGGRVFQSGTGDLDAGSILSIQYELDPGYWNTTGSIIDGDADNVTISVPHDFDGVPAHVAYRRPASGAAVSYFNGENDTDSTITTAIGAPNAPGAAIGAARSIANVLDYAYAGFIAHVAVYDSDIGASRIAAHATAAIAPLYGLRSDEQVQWALDTIGVPATMYDLDQGVSLMGSASTAGRNALEFIRDVARTEQGGFYVAHHDGGKLHFRNRYASFLETRSTVAQATFSDDPAVTDACRVAPDTLQVEANGVQSIINQASVTWLGGEVVVDESTGSPYGPRPVQIQTVAQNPNVARGVGQWIVALNDTPRSRIRSLGIDPGAVPAELPIALGLRIGDRVSYRSKPQNVGAATTKELEVLGRAHSVEGMEWVSTYYLTVSPSDAVDLFTLGTSELGGSHILAY